MVSCPVARSHIDFFSLRWLDGGIAEISPTQGADDQAGHALQEGQQAKAPEEHVASEKRARFTQTRVGVTICVNMFYLNWIVKKL